MHAPVKPLDGPSLRPSFGPGLALRLALRDLRAGLRGFGVFIACLALGVMTIAAVASASRGLTEGLAREGRRILVVEDDVRNVYALTNILEPRGATVEIARNGQEALDLLQRFTTEPAAAVDLVLMDVMMPVMDGLAATREIRKNPLWKKLPVIVLTAKAMPDDQQRCIEAGANDYMAKPLDVEKLLSLVRVWMPK